MGRHEDATTDRGRRVERPSGPGGRPGRKRAEDYFGDEPFPPEGGRDDDRDDDEEGPEDSGVQNTVRPLSDGRRYRVMSINVDGMTRAGGGDAGDARSTARWSEGLAPVDQTGAPASTLTREGATGSCVGFPGDDGTVARQVLQIGRRERELVRRRLGIRRRLRKR